MPTFERKRSPMRISKLPSRITFGTWLLVAGIAPINYALADDVLAGQYYERALQAYREHNNEAAIIELKTRCSRTNVTSLPTCYSAISTCNKNRFPKRKCN